MNEIQSNAPDDSTITGCVNCGNSAILKNFPTSLCEECRQKFIKFPFPLWVKVFAAVICLVLLFSLVSLSKNISLAIKLEKGKKAEKQKKYLTAENQFKDVVEKIPNNIEAEGNLMIASFYNQDFQTFASETRKLENVHIEDQELYEQLNELITKANSYVPSDSFYHFQQTSVDSSQNLSDQALLEYLHKNPDDLYAGITYASNCFNEKKYQACDSSLRIILKKDDQYFSALLMMASLKREEGKLDESLDYCNKVLALNKESIYGNSSKARTFLKEKKDKEALELALTCYKMDKKNVYNLATLALAYHYNNQYKERDEIISNTKKRLDSTEKEQFQYALDVIQNKEKFRD